MQRLGSTRSQLLLGLIIIGTMVLSATMLAIVGEQVRQGYQSAEREITTLSSLTQGSLNRALRYELPDAVDDVLLELHTHRRVRNVLKVAADGTIINVADTYQQHIQGQLISNVVAYVQQDEFNSAQQRNVISYVRNNATGRYQVYVPVLATGVVFGRPVQLMVFFEYEHQVSWLGALAARKRAIAGAAAFLLVVFLVLATYLQSRISRPVAVLYKAMERLEGGEVVPKIPVYGASELAELARKTEQMIRERILTEKEISLLSAALEQSNDGVIITSLLPKIEYVNRALVDNTGFSEAELLGQSPSMLGSGKTPETTYSAMWAALRAGKPWTGEFVNQRKDGSLYTELQTISPVRNKQGEITHYLGIKQDITEQKLNQQKLHQLAYYNPLTQLPNRLSLIEFIDSLPEQGHKLRNCWLLLINVDRMKRINDARGYDYGNMVINAVAKRLQNEGSTTRMLAHPGADNFACVQVFNNAGKVLQEQATDFAWRMKAAVESPIEVFGEQISLTVSIGFACLAQSANAEDLYRHAETALHRAKSGGGNDVAAYQLDDSKEAESLFGLERDLQHAVEQQQIELYLQAQFAPSGGVIGAEALARWQHPEQGMIPPDQFISIAERSDLIIELDKLMLRNSAEYLAKWQQHGLAYTISVNISPRFFRSKRLQLELQAIFSAANARMDGLIIEVTERLFINDMHDVISQMEEIKALGAQFALDDFGTGYSSLAYLQRLPINELKIDQSFTQGLPHNPRDVAMVNTIVAIAASLQLRIVAEGIETAAQRDFCTENNIHMQGYFFAKPQPAAIWQQNWLSNIN